jgi:hypothetical protein
MTAAYEEGLTYAHGLTESKQSSPIDLKSKPQYQSVAILSQGSRPQWILRKLIPGVSILAMDFDNRWAVRHPGIRPNGIIQEHCYEFM